MLTTGINDDDDGGALEEVAVIRGEALPAALRSLKTSDVRILMLMTARPKADSVLDFEAFSHRRSNRLATE